jgi:hypothetical protein
MTKRYKGGLISSTAPSPFTGGFWSLVEHIQGTKAESWPKQLAVAQIGTTTYDATGVGSVTDISELASNTEVMSVLPNSGYLRYNLNVGTSVNSITVSYRKASSNTLVQSAFSMFGSSLAYVDGAVSAILYAANDDHDSLFMDADGRGVLARFNTNNISASGNWTKFAGTTTIVADNTIDNVVTYPVTSFIGSGQNGSIVSFPLTNSSVWINLTSGTYKVNGFTGGSLPALGITTAAATNSLFTISDGVNSFIMGRYGTSTAGYYKVNLTTGVITGTAFVYDVSPQGQTGANTLVTEEDAIGAQLFTVDCFNTYLYGLTMYYGGSNHWLTTANPFPTTGKSTFVAGPGSNSTLETGNSIGHDIFGSVDPSDRSIWFADWGHDDGGLYNVQVDLELGTRKTNMKLIPTTYTN